MSLRIKYGTYFPGEEERIRAQRLREAWETGRLIREEVERTTSKCERCNGNGRLLTGRLLEACPDCAGSGRVPKQEAPDLDLEFACPPQWIRDPT